MNENRVKVLKLLKFSTVRRPLKGTVFSNQDMIPETVAAVRLVLTD